MHSEKNASHTAYLSRCSLALTLTFDLCTSQSIQFIVVPNWT